MCARQLTPATFCRHVADDVTIEVRGHDDIVLVRLGCDAGCGNVHNLMINLNLWVFFGHAFKHLLKGAVCQLHDVGLGHLSP